jgi:esterase FrsA
MNDVEELKQFAVVHARTQGIPEERCAALLARIDSDDGDAVGSWAGEWSRAAGELERQGLLLEACQHYVMARFPYVDGPARQHALDGSLRTFEGWRAPTGLKRFDVAFAGGQVRCWADLPAPGKPLLLIMGGIVSVKEQWAPLLLRLRELGFGGIVTEMPSCGENTVRYDLGSWRMLSAVLDAAGAGDTYAMAMSFSGHLALRCALDDDRIKGILTVGAPVGAYFTDTRWQREVPRVTVDTLAHLTGTKPADVGEHMRDWALSTDELRRLDVPLAYVTSLRDEIIPPQDIELLRRHIRRLDVLANDDVHGSPAHTGVTAPWLIESLLKMRRGDQ